MCTKVKKVQLAEAAQPQESTRRHIPTLSVYHRTHSSISAHVAGRVEQLASREKQLPAFDCRIALCPLGRCSKGQEGDCRDILFPGQLWIRDK